MEHQQDCPLVHSLIYTIFWTHQLNVKVWKNEKHSDFKYWENERFYYLKHCKNEHD